MTRIEFLSIIRGMSILLRIQELRRAAGFEDAAQFATAVGVTPAYVRNIEAGRQVPGKKAAWKIAEFLGRRLPGTDAKELFTSLLLETDPELTSAADQAPPRRRTAS